VGHRLILSPSWRVACTVLNVVPLPGVGAILAGWKNPHTRLMRDGIAQLVLVVFGAWPLILPGVAGIVWAAWTALAIHRDAVAPGPLSRPTRRVAP
jgi:hypothetical protein